MNKLKVWRPFCIGKEIVMLISNTINKNPSAIFDHLKEPLSVNQNTRLNWQKNQPEKEFACALREDDVVEEPV